MSGDFQPDRLLRRPGPPVPDNDFRGVQIDDAQLRGVLAPNAPLLVLHEGAIHAEGPAWQGLHRRLLFSDVPNRRLNAWYEADGRVEVVIATTRFMNGNAVAADGSVWHCEHGRRCISRSAPDLDGEPEPIVTHFEGRRLNSPNDVTVGPDGAVWFTDPIFGIAMPSQRALAVREIDHRSLYRFDHPSGRLDRIADFEQPNGVALSLDERIVYASDTSLSLGEVPGYEAGDRHAIYRLAVTDDGSVGEPEFFCHTDHGYPDGFAVDTRGWVWTSAADGVHVWSAAREKLGFVPTPETVSNLTFGGSDARRLFIAASTRLLAIDLIG